MLRASSTARMLPNQVACDRSESDTPPCGATALIHDLRFIYANEPPVPRDSPVGAELQVECPKCGMRRQFVWYEAPA
jgi:hypothetical protein